MYRFIVLFTAWYFHCKQIQDNHLFSKKRKCFFYFKEKKIVIRFKKKENKIFICLEKKVNKQIVISDFTTRIGVKHTVRGFGEIVILVL